MSDLRRWWADKWEEWYVPFYCRFAHFHLMRARSDGHYIIVHDFNHEPQVDGYYIETSCWTPRGCRRAAATSIWFNAMVDAVGRENILNAMKKAQEQRP